MHEPRQIAVDIFHAALKAVDPERAVERECDGIRQLYREDAFSRLIVVGFGKASSAMAHAVEASLGDLVEAGIIITKYGHGGQHPLEKIRLLEGGHPLPDDNGLRATREIIRLAREADERTLVVTLISGGGSALLVSPAPGITLADKQRTTNLLLQRGADIFELNAVRKHLSQVKGGRFAELLQPAAIISLVLSDVPGDRIDVIASGPTAPDTTTFGDALAVLERYRVHGHIPASVGQHLARGREGIIPETPKEGNPVFRKIRNRIIGSLAIALEGAAAEAKTQNFIVERVREYVTGEAREAGKRLAQRALELKRLKRQGGPVCLIAGGETTVTVAGTGKGGRNMELALSFSLEIAGVPGITLLSAGTDGNDGPTDAAGAFADGMTAVRALDKGLDPAVYLADNDSYGFFREEGGLFITGPTGTNVMDLQLVLIE
ncbi:MAG TPA: glycerate kinase [Geobacteraceae bacterium]|nr:glycerate kinase [Geobacteraceae bacterium]